MKYIQQSFQFVSSYNVFLSFQSTEKCFISWRHFRDDLFISRSSSCYSSDSLKFRHSFHNKLFHFYLIDFLFFLFIKHSQVSFQWSFSQPSLLSVLTYTLPPTLLIHFSHSLFLPFSLIPHSIFTCLCFTQKGNDCNHLNHRINWFHCMTVSMFSSFGVAIE